MKIFDALDSKNDEGAGFSRLPSMMEEVFKFSFLLSPGSSYGHDSVWYSLLLFLRQRGMFLTSEQIEQMRAKVPIIQPPTWHPHQDSDEIKMRSRLIWSSWLEVVNDYYLSADQVRIAMDLMLEGVVDRDLYSFNGRIDQQHGKAPYLHTMEQYILHRKASNNEFLDWYSQQVADRYRLLQSEEGLVINSSLHGRINKLDGLYGQNTGKRHRFLR